VADDTRVESEVAGPGQSKDAPIRTFLIADIRGYTVFTQERGDEAAALLAGRFAEAAREAVAARDGTVVELRGDEALVVFDSARQAIRAAIELQRRFVDATVADPTLPLAVGIGLDAGEAVPVDDGYRGGALNLAARLCSIAAPAEILASTAVTHLARKVDGVAYVDRGAVRLKGLKDPVQVIRLRAEADDPAEDIAFRRALGSAAARLVPDVPGAIVANPYKGLRSFEEADAADYFGREELIEQLVKRLGGTRFLAVVGPSGSGKSSVVRAGLLPAIRRGAIPASERWWITDMFPAARPLDGLEAALLRAVPDPPASLMDQLERDEHGLHRAILRLLPSDATELVLVIDQFEEVFTLVEDESVRVHFLGSLENAVRDPRSRLRVVTTLRADFYDRPLLYRGFAELFKSRVEAVIPLSAEELERAISGPAKRVDVSLEPGLVAAVLADIAEEPGALPLMQYALTELFERRDGRTLSLEAYREIGGVSGALGRRAEELYAELDDGGREAAHQLFLRLVTLGEGTEDTRRRVPRSEVASLDVDQHAMTAVLDAFGASRQLSFDRDAKTGAPTIELAHEAILTAWPRLNRWIDVAREDLRAQRRVAAAARDWVESNRDRSFLLGGSRLEQAEAWRSGSAIALTPEEGAYLDASRAERDRQQADEEARAAHERDLERRSVRRLRALVAVFAVAAVVAASLTIVARDQSSRAERAARVSRTRELAAATLANLDTDPEFGILLAIEAVQTTRTADGTVLREAEEALHQAVQASRINMRLPGAAAVEFSRDGSRLATAGNGSALPGDPVAVRDTKAVVWDASTGERLLTLSGHRSRVWDVEFSPDGSLMATGSEDGTAAIWDGETGERLHTLPGHEANSYVFADFSPDGAKLLTSDGGPGDAGTVRLWDTRSGRLEREWSADGGICAIVFSPDGRLAAGTLCGGQLGEALVWDPRTGERVLALEGPPGEPLFDIAWSPDGGRLVTAGLVYARVWDAATGDEVLTVTHGSVVASAAFGPDGTYVATGGTDGKARVWDTATGSLVHVLSAYGGGSCICDVEFSPNGRHLITGGSEDSLLWDIGHQGSREQATVGGDDFMNSVTYSPDGSLLLTTSSDGVATLWDASSGRAVRTFPDHDASWDAAFGPDGRSFVTSGIQGSPVLWDVTSGGATRVLDVEGWIASVAVSPDGTTIATAVGIAGQQTALVLWDASSGERVTTLDEDPGEIDDLEFSPDGTLLAGASATENVTVWELSSGEALRSLSAGDEHTWGVAFSPDGELLAASGPGGTVKVWRVATGELFQSMVGHIGSVSDVAFSPDGQMLATAGEDRTARLWDVSTGRELLMLTGHASGIIEVAFSPDGTRLATAGDETVRVYVLPIQELIDLARSRLTRSWTEDECRHYLHLPEGCP
jgi:WD40 repeat protein/class 3 adenylate cyclase